MPRAKGGKLLCLAPLLGLLFLGGCVTMSDYATAYMRSAKPSGGVEPFHEFQQRMLRSRHTRQVLYPDKEHAAVAGDAVMNCAWFRNQLYVASIGALKHTKVIWGLPFLWPWHVATGLYWPVAETRLANQVRDAAKRMERAYQLSDEALISACRAEANTPLFAAFESARGAQLAAAERSKRFSNDPS